MPNADAAVTAGKLLEDLAALWEKANLGECRRILLTMLDAVYVDTVEERRIVAIRPWPAFSVKGGEKTYQRGGAKPYH